MNLYPKHVVQRRMETFGKMLVMIDAEIEASMLDKVRGYGLIDIREWLEHAILHFVEECQPPINLSDPVTTAIAQATNAAMDNDMEEYRAAREREAAARIEAQLEARCPF